MPHKSWTLVIGYDRAAETYTLRVNDVDISALVETEAPKTTDTQPIVCKSSDKKKYSENIRSVTCF